MNIEKKSHWADKYNYYQFLGSKAVYDNDVILTEEIHFGHKAIDNEGKTTFTHEIMVMRNGVYSDTIIYDADVYEQFYVSSESFKHEQPK